ncbi:MAG: glycosyltransferase family 9 protein [Candidatus Omnitrophica bacterium]|nr:glycosyltransferase family 9 protein [Candidatus Omnitrophota bacterium]
MPDSHHSPILPKRILVIRLDRLGDVILSTPVLQALRSRFPHAFIAMMVRPACHDVVEGNPALNEVILYDKEGTHHSVQATIRFARQLRRFDFDTALVLHPTNRSHWIPWLARIPVRVGYDRKCGWLLTHRIPHRKQEGSKHEAIYTLELLAPFAITPPSPKPFVPFLDRAPA